MVEVHDWIQKAIDMNPNQFWLYVGTVLSFLYFIPIRKKSIQKNSKPQSSSQQRPVSIDCRQKTVIKPADNSSSRNQMNNVNPNQAEAKTNIEKDHLDADVVIDDLIEAEELENRIPANNLGVQENEFLYVNYSITRNDQIEQYPILRVPKKGTVVRSYRLGSSKRRGFKEESFQKLIQTVFDNDFYVLGDVRLNTGQNTRPFEPDIALVSIKNKALKIDIEIDEPYAGITRQPTHCAGEDTLRDIYFVDRGWLVVRFTEHQVCKDEKGCLKYLAEIIRALDPQFETPQALLNHKPVAEEKTWDIVQAQKWEKEMYREAYLQHSFGKVEDKRETSDRGLNEHEIQEEKLVKSTPIGKPDRTPATSFNLTNTHPRDNRIEFYPEEHVYLIDNTVAPSASALVSKFFPAFDAYGRASNLSRNNLLYGMPVDEIVKTWKSRGEEAAKKGTYLHQQIEKYFLGETYKETEEFKLFKQFIADHPEINPYRSEWRVFDEEFHVAGTIDLISWNGNELEIFDWKRSNKIIDQLTRKPIIFDQWGNYGVGQLEDLDDTRYNRYCLQQSLYKYILEKNYGISISRMYLVILHPDYFKYYKIEVPYMEDEINYILNSL